MDGCPLQSLDRGLLVRANADRVLGRRHIEPDDLRRPATDSGSLLSHQDLRPDRSIFRSRRTRQICCSCTSRVRPPATARSDAQILPKEPVPAGTILRLWTRPRLVR
jgi:hypothetical protein